MPRQNINYQLINATAVFYMTRGKYQQPKQVNGLPQINVAIAGVGNCCSALIQGLQYYSRCEKDNCVGLRNPVLGSYDTKDIKIVAAFDIDQRKIGIDIAEAIFAEPNNTPRLLEKVTPSQVIVKKGPVMDGVGEYTKHVIRISPSPESDVADVLKQRKAEILINLLPSGATRASEFYAEQALEAQCAFANATPHFIASDQKWIARFENAGLPLVGDDLVDQVGATTLHKTLLNLLSTNGVRITQTYQLDVGGGTESLDTLGRTKEIKRKVKTKTVEAALPYKAEVVAGSTDYVDFLGNRRDSYFWIRGVHFCNVPMFIDLKLSTVDAPNAGSVLLDIIRATKIALDRHLKGSVQPICAYAFKHPPTQTGFEEAEKSFVQFLA